VLTIVGSLLVDPYVATGAIGAGQKKTDALLELVDVNVLESDYGGNNPSKDRGVIKVRVPSFSSVPSSPLAQPSPHTDVPTPPKKNNNRRTRRSPRSQSWRPRRNRRAALEFFVSSRHCPS
jgi:hypothetical protein